MNLRKGNAVRTQAPGSDVQTKGPGPSVEAQAVLARVVTLHLEGKRKEALRELTQAGQIAKHGQGRLGIRSSEFCYCPYNPCDLQCAKSFAFAHGEAQ